MLMIFFWVLSLVEDLGLGNKTSGKLRRGDLCTPGNNYIQSEKGGDDDDDEENSSDKKVRMRGTPAPGI